MFFRLDLLVTPHPKSLGLDAASWAPAADGRRGGRTAASRGRRPQVRRPVTVERPTTAA
jgi:hypothetical protein